MIWGPRLRLWWRSPTVVLTPSPRLGYFVPYPAEALAARLEAHGTALLFHCMRDLCLRARPWRVVRWRLVALPVQRNSKGAYGQGAEVGLRDR